MTQWASRNQAIQRLFVLVIFLVWTQSVFSETSQSTKPLMADFVGTQACVDCHQKQFTAWKGSHHDMAMKHADPQSVLGDFNDYVFNFNGKANRFYRKNDQYWVNVQGADGNWHDYKVSYTFGWQPLQQYMVEFGDGRVQLLPFAWDSRRKEEGGQRWFHLYPETTPTDEFYWTNSGQNWNFMCADCHSTNVQKNYDAQLNTYSTTWSEINVGCEACHGPASKHMELAQSDKLSKQAIGHLGFDRDLSKAVKEWVQKEGHSTLQPKEIVMTQQVQTCAQCHSRRTQLNETGDHVNDSFFDKYRLSLITPELYHYDGQIYDEVYVYGSFLQSEMAKKGVTCTNCHDPHNAQLKIAEEAVCLQCHSASEYSPEKHTFHTAGTKASKCTTCHMPETTYMQVDPRRDHSWHVPRPDLSQHINTPNVCTSCHEDKTAQWADAQIGKWYPNSTFRNQRHFSLAFYADAIGHRGAPDALAFSAQDSSLSDIIRASALERMGGNTGQNTLVSLARSVKHDDEMIRLGAIAGSSGYSFSDRWQILEPLLSDPVLSVRAEAAGALVRSYSEMNPLQKEKLQPALDDYKRIQIFNSDRGFGRTNLGNLYRDLGETDKAIDAYNKAIEIEPYFENSYVNLADLYRAQNKETKAIEVLSAGMKAQPKSSALPYSAGLAWLRRGNDNKAMKLLKQAAETAKRNPHYWYVYGLALEKTNVLAASQALNTAYEVGGDPQHLYAECDVLARNYKAGGIAFAFEQCVNRLSKQVPPQVVEQLRAKVVGAGG
ncbi:tetratricopeptide repeat protein [Vibrio sp. Of14-4]|uniref:cytochrome c3 family protein n=1 Tax=Vibrio sp. Of14-4 TaxID=2724878 RepID=UPI001EF39F91|nr:cytochrome c3 family protein [Vibrio sp. Of14-4]MCG7490436.1 tetratricopeptide repeat protein [Vibrio sp. Of14-4]